MMYLVHLFLIGYQSHTYIICTCILKNLAWGNMLSTFNINREYLGNWNYICLYTVSANYH